MLNEATERSQGRSLMKTVVDAGDGRVRGIPILALVIVNESGFTDERQTDGQLILSFVRLFCTKKYSEQIFIGTSLILFCSVQILHLID